ncbi:MAG TPA: hypothetical protein VNY52_08560 [Solirubrobacteraceae bacterium]|jgi:hypothetical protein|nr:hypothetical protein [Solirubrobacteraceae bacterium]
MNTTSSTRDEERVLSDFRDALNGWRNALEAHRMAPPDHGFSTRLAGLARAASEEACACRAADAAGFDWPPHRAADPRPPYELQPGTGRRGPESLWRRFDEAVRQLNTAATGQNMLDVAHTYDKLAAAAAELAEAVEREDGASGRRPRARARRSA